MGGDDHAVVNLLAMSAAYSPDPARPLGVALPFDLATARVDERVSASSPPRIRSLMGAVTGPEGGLPT